MEADTTYIDMERKRVILPLIIFGVGVIMMFFEHTRMIGPFVVGIGLGFLSRRL